LTNLKYFYVNNNQLTSLPPEIGKLVNLKKFRVENNPNLSGKLPDSLQNNKGMVSFLYTNTQLCEPTDTDFQDWLSSIKDLRNNGTVVQKLCK